MAVTDQRSLFDLDADDLQVHVPHVVPVLDESELQTRFRRFHTAHPEVYVRLRGYALALIGRGYERLSIGMLWELIRYDSMVGAAPGEEPYRLNNSYRSRYARLLMDHEPSIDGKFETRELRAPDEERSP
jgi:hypothetical protein